MAFPGTYNINYYKGDTYEFRVYPKIASGATFDLEDYTVAGFYLSTERGGSTIEAVATIEQDSSGLWYVQCAIPPGTGSALDSSIDYVYDVEILKPAVGAGYPYRYTLLTGTISITEDVGEVSV